MKFFSDRPNLHIIRQRLVGNRTEHFELCVFDENGELETEDPEVIRQLTNIYRHEDSKKYKCKKCDYETSNKGELLSHYRESHPKE